MVIHYDPWWNVAAQDQATDRAYRIGQRRDVTVFKLICEGTVEERILKMQESKRGLAESVLGAEAVRSATLTRDDVLALLGRASWRRASAGSLRQLPPQVSLRFRRPSESFFDLPQKVLALATGSLHNKRAACEGSKWWV